MVVSVMTIFTVFPFLFHRNVDKIKKWYENMER